MRVLITNSLVLAAISLAPAASAAPYTTTTSGVDTLEAHPNSTVFAQNSGPSSIPSMLYPYGRILNLSRPTSPLDARRDEIIRVQSLYDHSSPFGDVFGPVAKLFGNIGMNTISDEMPLSDAQKVVLDKLHDALNDAAGGVMAQFPASRPLSSLSSRSLEDHQLPNPLSTVGSLSLLSDSLSRVSDFLSSVGIPSNPATPMDDRQKQIVANIQNAIIDAVGNAVAGAPRPGVSPFSHKDRSIEERSLDSIASLIDQSTVGPVLKPITSIIASLGISDGRPLNDAKMQAMSQLQAAVAKAVEDIETNTATVHIQHTREDQDHRDHHDEHRAPHKDDHNPHDQDGDRRKPHGEHKDHDKSWDEHQEPGKPWEERKDAKWFRDADKDDHRLHDVRKDDYKPHGAHEDGHKSPDDHDDHGPHQEGDHCREHGQWHDCKHHKDGDEDSSLIKINLGHSHHP
jgi:hypothetical protein